MSDMKLAIPMDLCPGELENTSLSIQTRSMRTATPRPPSGAAWSRCVISQIRRISVKWRLWLKTGTIEYERSARKARARPKEQETQPPRMDMGIRKTSRAARVRRTGHGDGDMITPNTSGTLATLAGNRVTKQWEGHRARLREKGCLRSGRCNGGDGASRYRRLGLVCERGSLGDSCEPLRRPPAQPRRPRAPRPVELVRAQDMVHGKTGTRRSQDSPQTPTPPPTRASE